MSKDDPTFELEVRQMLPWPGPVLAAIYAGLFTGLILSIQGGLIVSILGWSISISLFYLLHGMYNKLVATHNSMELLQLIDSLGDMVSNGTSDDDSGLTKEHDEEDNKSDGE